MKNRRIIVASNNKGKINEIKNIFKDYEIFSISDIEKEYGKNLIVTEEQDTFEGNALEKAKSLYNQLQEKTFCIADDSGISIDALDGFPGVHTARWLDADDHEKNIQLLKKLEGVEKDKRTCHYTTAISFVGKDVEKVFEYTLDGIISSTPRGENGFGFDEIFELSNKSTLAELPIEEKLKYSPRKKALEQMKEFLKEEGLI